MIGSIILRSPWTHQPKGLIGWMWISGWGCCLYFGVMRGSWWWWNILWCSNINPKGWYWTSWMWHHHHERVQHQPFGLMLVTHSSQDLFAEVMNVMHMISDDGRSSDSMNITSCTSTCWHMLITPWHEWWNIIQCHVDINMGVFWFDVQMISMIPLDVNDGTYSDGQI